MANQFTNKHTKAALKDLGFDFDPGQNWLYGKVRRDTFRFIDVLALRMDFGILAVQATTLDGLNAHREALIGSEACRIWASWAHVHLWAWQRVGPPRQGMVRGPWIEQAIVTNGVLSFVPIDISELIPKPDAPKN